MSEMIFKRAELYSKSYGDLINSLQEFIRGVNDIIEDLDAEVHIDLWDTSLAYVDLTHCEMNIHNADNCKIFNFVYYVPYENFQEHYKITITKEYESMTYEEVARYIISQSEAYFNSEKKFKIERLNRELQKLQSE